MTDPSPQNTALPNGPGQVASRGHKRQATFHRLAIALLGGYAFTWGFIALGMAALVALGVDLHAAETALLLLAFLVFLSLFLWAFATASLVRVWAVLAGGGVLMTAAAWGLQRALLS